MRQTFRTVAGGFMVLILATSAAYSANFRGFRDRVPPPATRVDAGPVDRDPDTPGGSSTATSLRSYPWWAPVTHFSGTGPTTTDDFSIEPFALQWRADFSCEAGHLLVQSQRPSGEAVGQPLIDESCPSDGIALAVSVDDFVLDVEATGGWEVVIEEQVDVPLVEPLTPEMEKGRVVARGDIYSMDRRGEGKMAVYRLADGSMMLRLEDFYISPNVDLEIDVSALERPKTTEDFDSAPYEQIALMPVTTGSTNYEIPRSIDLQEWGSIVIWCEPLHIAYAAATLESIR